MAQAEKKRLIFMGTPEFAATILRSVAAWEGGELVAVYTQPDRPAGRGNKLTPPAVKLAANELGLPVLQPQGFRNQEEIDRLCGFEPDFLVVAAYGVILPQAALDTARIAPVNVHASILPEWRGAAPIQRAIMAGWNHDAETGISIMRMVASLDAGPVYATAKMPIGEHTGGSLHNALADLGASILPKCLEDIASGSLKPVEQEEAKATYAAKLTRADSYPDWNQPVQAVHAHVRAVSPWPGSRFICRFDGQPTETELAFGPGRPQLVKELEKDKNSVTSYQPVLDAFCSGKPGSVIHSSHGLAIACADGLYWLDTVKPAGKRTMPVRDYLNGSLRDLPVGLCGEVLKGRI